MLSAAQTPPTPQNSEMLAALLAQIALRDRKAFSAIYHATSVKLFGTVLRILRRRALAEDVLQDVYVKIWERAGDFTPSRGSPITWMVAIARNRALDEVRRDKNLVSSEDVAGFEDIPASGQDALGQMQQSEEYRKLATCLGGIEEEKRRIVLMAYDQGLSREILSQRFGQPVSTIKTWLRRTLQSLKLCLDT